MSEDDVLKTIHELHVHQIELEMQNDELRKAQIELEESRSKYTDLFDFAPIGYFVLDKKGVITEVNLTGAVMMGIERNFLLGKPFALCIDNKQDKDTFYLKCREGFQTGTRSRFDLMMCYREKGQFPAELLIEPIINGDKQVNFCRIAVIDISARIHAERQVIEMAKFPAEDPFPVLRISKDGTIAYSNQPGEVLLNEWKCQIGQKAPKEWCHLVTDALQTGQYFVKEVNCDEKVFSFAVAPVIEGRYVNLYGRDLTKIKHTQEQLQKSEKKYRRLFNTMTEGFALHEIICDKKGKPCDYRFLEVNPAFELLTGLKAKEITGKAVKEVIPNIEQFWIDEYGEVALTGRSKNFDSFSKSLGKYFEVFAYRPAPMQFAVIFIDITERKKAEETIQIASERLVLAQRSAGAGIWDWNIETGKLNWSPELFLLLGLDGSNAEASFDSWNGVLHPDDKQIASDAIENAIREHKPLTNEYRVILPDGKTRWINALGNTIYDRDGKAIRMSGICIDITVNKKAEEEIKNLAKFPHENPFPVLRIKEDGTIIYSNNPGLVILKEWGCKIGQKVPNNWINPIKNSMQYNRQFTEQIKCGQNILSIAIAPIPDAGYVNLYGRDITIQEQIKDELRRARDELDLKVHQRTTELAQTIAILQKEIKDRQTAETQLKEHTKVMDAFFAHSITPLVILDKNFNFIRVNKAYADSCKKDINEFEGHNHFLFYPNEENESIFKQVVMTKQSYQALAKPFSFPERPELGVTYWNWTLVPILDNDGQVEFLVFSLMEVTKRKRAELALIESEEKYRSLIEFSPESVCVLVDEKIVFLNSAALKLIKAANDQEIAGKSIWDLIHPDFIDAMNYDIKQLQHKKGMVQQKEARIICLDGSTVEIELSATSINHQGNPGVLIIFHDITERKIAHEMVKAERQRMNDVLETLPAYVCLLTTDYQMPFANRVFRESFGYCPDKKCYEFLFNRTEPCEICETYSVLKDNKQHHWEWTGPNEHDYDVFDFPFKDTDGSQLILEMGIDVTERKKAQESLRLASQYTRTIIETSLDPLVMISHEGKITDVNKATEIVTGLSRNDLINTDFSDYFGEPEKARNGYKKVLSEGFVRDYPLTIKHISGRKTDVLYNAVVYKNESGQAQGVFAAARDITERKSAESRRTVLNSLLDLFVHKTTKKEYLDSVVKIISNWSGCKCVGIRLRNEDEYVPYESHTGFDNEFLSQENRLCLHTDACICARTITHTPESYDVSMLTSKGSFRCNNSIEFLESIPKHAQNKYRGTCMKLGFASLAIIPIHYREKILGAIHLADKQANKVPSENIEFLEDMAALIGEAVHRFDVESTLRLNEKRLVEAQRLAHLGNWEWDMIRNRLLWSDEVYRIFGLEPELFSITYNDYISYVHPQDRKLIQESVNNAVFNGREYSIDYRIIRPDGNERIINEKAEISCDKDSKPIRMTGTMYDITERKKAEDEIKRNQHELRTLSAKLQLAEEQERRRIAQDLHDSIGQILAFSGRELKTIQKSVPEKAAKAIAEIAKQLDLAVTQARTLSFDLSPSILYDLGFEVAVEDLVDRISKERGIECSFKNSPQPKPLTDDVKVLLYRSIRELLINSVKHSRAKHVKVSLLRSSSDIYIQVEDDGRGFDMSILSDSSTKRKGFGIFSIRERLNHIGGQLKIESAKDKGTKTVIIAPLNIESEKQKE
jgi:PAS domain S-box-containing protein